MPDTPQDKFLGMTRMQFQGLMVVLLTAIFLSQAYQIHTTQELASRADAQAKTNQHLITDGKEAHDALCVYKGGLQDAVRKSEQFLDLTVTERVAKYGEVGRIPDPVLKSQLARQRKAVADLRTLTCP